METGKKQLPLARRAKSYEPSFWTEFEQVSRSATDVISFGNGTPAREVQPVERLQWAATLGWAEAEGKLDYGDAPGYLPLRQLIAERMANQAMTVDPDLIMVTNGSQQGIDFSCRLLVDPGDLVVVEGPTYLGAIQVFEAFEATYLTAPVDGEGLDVAELARRLDRADKTPKMIYTIPTFQNPTGYTMTLARRHALVELARERGIVIVEDDPYGELYIGDPPPPPLKALDPDVIYLGTFSKTIAPGIRCGWVASPPDLIGKFLIAREATDLHGDRISQRTVYYAAKDFLDGHLVGARALYKQRRDTMLAALARELPPEVTWTAPDGGFFIWLNLPEGKSGYDLLYTAGPMGITFLTGRWFYPAQDEDRAFRLNFSTQTDERIEEGARRLGKAVRAYLTQ